MARRLPAAIGLALAAWMLTLSDVARHSFCTRDDVMSDAIWVLGGTLAVILFPVPAVVWAAVFAKKKHRREAAMSVLKLLLNTVVKLVNRR
ncbi:hypothetical protein [Streptosporangium sandarakinum]|uniref:hypothetical protein n=1 Tax=Streptosporangium sandarakinum TaxID=1260955 RepID=UPI003432C1DA